MQRPSLTIEIPDYTFDPSESFSAMLEARRSRQQHSAARAFLARSSQLRGAGRAFVSSSMEEPGARRPFFWRSRLASLRALLSRSRSRQEHRASHAGYLLTVPASTEAIMGLPESAAAETREVGCAVCQEDFEEDDDLRRMPCSHSFHEHCIFRWLQISRACPCCRIPLPSVNEQRELDED